MNSRERMSKAISFQEADRVPIELMVGPHARKMPEAKRIVEFVDNEADNFLCVPLVNWGFFGLETEYNEEIIEDIPGEFRRVKRTHSTPAGDFVAITKHSYETLESTDFHWQRRFIHDLEDMKRLADAPRKPRPVDPDKYRNDDRKIVGERGMTMTPILHPLGTLVRNSTMEEVYGWFISEPELIHTFLKNSTEQIVATMKTVAGTGVKPWFITWAHEMLIPPWMGMEMFEEWVFPYDKAVNDEIHTFGGKRRCHCHGNCMTFMEKMYEMGIDSLEPLEPPPFGDIDLAKAKKIMHGKMHLSGYVASQHFPTIKPAETRKMVKKALEIGAPGGGYSLRTTGGQAGLADNLNPEQRKNVIANIEAYIDAGLEFGRY